MTWLVDVAAGFALGYLAAFLKYKKGVLQIFKTGGTADGESGALETEREQAEGKP